MSNTSKMRDAVGRHYGTGELAHPIRQALQNAYRGTQNLNSAELCRSTNSCGRASRDERGGGGIRSSRRRRSGFGERYGAASTNGLSDIMIGGAILPSLLHQDPRYFYQGTGTTKSRMLQAVSGPFVCRGDNGGLQPNSVQLRAPRNLGGEIELSGAEHPPVEVQKATRRS